mmetsp:Transcript_78921/g.115588  ORF Transcript_78921/g.115588 Transcript_78921/m.115588 type:complete len:230 (-) Transcript_78921:471-1160(-)
MQLIDTNHCPNRPRGGASICKCERGRNGRGRSWILARCENVLVIHDDRLFKARLFHAVVQHRWRVLIIIFRVAANGRAAVAALRDRKRRPLWQVGCAALCARIAVAQRKQEAFSTFLLCRRVHLGMLPQCLCRHLPAILSTLLQSSSKLGDLRIQRLQPQNRIFSCAFPLVCSNSSRNIRALEVLLLHSLFRQTHSCVGRRAMCLSCHSRVCFCHVLILFCLAHLLVIA